MPLRPLLNEERAWGEEFNAVARTLTRSLSLLGRGAFNPESMSMNCTPSNMLFIDGR